ncbi:MAG: hypothetical protein WAQ25_04815 [Candidatus Saccharimonas sp.]
MEHFFRYIGNIFGTLRAEYRQLANRYFGTVERFDGDARAICRQIVARLWEGEFYRTSLGHFDFFWMRDFGTACHGLLKTNPEQVHATLSWAMRHYRRAGTVSTCIDQAGNCFEAPSKSIDALPWLLHCLVVSDYTLHKSERQFLERMLRRYKKRYLEPQTGMLRSRKWSEMRDAVMYDRSAYAVTMVARLARCAKRLELDFPYQTEQYRELLVSHYWNGHYFNADYGNDAFSAECALFPLYMGIVDDPVLAGKTLDYIANQKLNKPYPMLYTNQPDAFHYHWWMTAPFMPQYEGQTLWSWHGVFYLHLLKRCRRPEYEHQYQSFARMIERHGTWPEMLNADGSWYNAPVYKGDPGMIWCALFLELS